MIKKPHVYKQNGVWWAQYSSILGHAVRWAGPSFRQACKLAKDYYTNTTRAA